MKVKFTEIQNTAERKKYKHSTISPFLHTKKHTSISFGGKESASIYRSQISMTKINGLDLYFIRSIKI